MRGYSPAHHPKERLRNIYVARKNPAGHAKLARQQAKKTATDFERYTAMKAKVKRSAAIKAKLAK